jgi:opacity protein-like surface antigen
MKMTLLAAAAVAALAAATSASANVVTPGVYVAGDFGYHWPSDYQTDLPGGAKGPVILQKNDWVAFGRLGYAFNPNWRIELEGGYRPGDVDRVFWRSPTAVPGGLCRGGVVRTAAAPTCGPLGGEMNVTTAMVNAIYDIAPGGRFHPFIGAGAGVACNHLQVAGQFNAVPAGNLPYQNLAIDDTDRHFAYQGILGVSFDITDRIAFDVTGRYLRSTFNFHGRTTNGGPAGPGGLIDLGRLRGA